jgi:26S proteasome regulatory subunit N6
MAPAESARIQEAQKIAKTDPRKAEAQYREIISKPPSATSDAAVHEYETALVSLGELYRDEKWATRMRHLIWQITDI